MIDYETYCRIVAMNKEHISASRIAGRLGIDERTVVYWLEAGRYQPRKGSRRSSKLDSYRPAIMRLLETYPYSAVQVYQKLKEQGYGGGISIVKEYVAKVRPRAAKAFLTLSFEPGECAQVDWGSYGAVAVGSTSRRLYFFSMVLCCSRMLYVEFTVSQKMEHFLGCHLNAFEFFGGVPKKIMVDNLKSAVIERIVGCAPVFNQRYLDFAGHYGFEIRACNVGKGNEKGRVENTVGYVKKNFLAGLDIPNFSVINPACRRWLDEIANVRIHGATHKKPVDLFLLEKPALGRLPVNPYDGAIIYNVRATNQFRVIFETNRYSVPAEYAGARLTLKAYPERLCVYSSVKLIARHPRSYDRHQDFENPDHPKLLLQQRRNAREQHLLMRFMTLSPKSEWYYRQLAQRRMNPRRHIQIIMGLSEIYGLEKTARTLEDACALNAFGCEYIANILEQRERVLPQAGALSVTHRSDLLEMDMPEPNLSIYDTAPAKGDQEYENK